MSAKELILMFNVLVKNLFSLHIIKRCGRKTDKMLNIAKNELWENVKKGKVPPLCDETCKSIFLLKLGEKWTCIIVMLGISG